MVCVHDTGQARKRTTEPGKGSSRAPVQNPVVAVAAAAATATAAWGSIGFRRGRGGGRGRGEVEEEEVVEGESPVHGQEAAGAGGEEVGAVYMGCVYMCICVCFFFCLKRLFLSKKRGIQRGA